MSMPVRISRNMPNMVRVGKEFLRNKVNKMDMNNPTDEDFNFIKRVILPKLRSVTARATLGSLQPNEEGKRRLVREVHKMLNNGRGETAASLKKKVEASKPKKENLNVNTDKLKKVLGEIDLGIISSGLNVGPEVQREVENIEKKVEEAKKTVGTGETEVTVENSKPVVNAEEEVKETTEPSPVPSAQVEPDGVHNVVNMEEEVESIDTKDYVDPETKMKDDIINFSIEVGNEVINRAVKCIENGGQATPDDFMSEITKVLLKENGNVTMKMSQQMRDTLADTTLQYIGSLTQFHNNQLASIQQFELMESQKQYQIINGMVGVIEHNAQENRMQLQEFMNKGAQLLQNLSIEGRKERKELIENAQQLLANQSKEHLVIVDRMSAQINSLTEQNREMQEKLLQTNATVKEISDNMVKNVLLMNQNTLSVVQDLVSKLTDNIVNIKTHVDVENGVRVERKEADTSVPAVPVSFANYVVGEFADIAKDSNKNAHTTTRYTTERAFNQSEGFGSSFVNLEAETQNNVFNTVKEAFNKINVPTEDPTSHSVNKTVSAGGISLEEALKYFKEAQLLAQSLVVTRSEITVGDYTSLANKIFQALQLNDEAKEQAREYGIDVGAIEKAARHMNEVTTKYSDAEPEDRVKRNDAKNVDDMLDTLDSITKGMSAVVNEQKTEKQQEQPVMKDTSDIIEVPNYIRQYGLESVGQFIYDNSKDLNQVFEIINHEPESVKIYNKLYSSLKRYDDVGGEAFRKKAIEKGVILTPVPVQGSSFSHILTE